MFELFIRIVQSFLVICCVRLLSPIVLPLLPDKPATKSRSIVCHECEGSVVNSKDHFNAQFKAGGFCWLCSINEAHLTKLADCARSMAIRCHSSNATLIFRYKNDTKTESKSSTRLECMMQDYPKTLPPTSRVMDTWLAYTLVKNNPEDAAKVDMDRAGRSDIPDIDKKKLEYTTFLVIVDAEDQIEVSFSRNYIPEAKDSKAVLMDIDLRYTLLRGESGCYSYGILDRQKWLGYTIPNAMLPYTLFRMKFRNVVIADNRRRKMPLPEDQMKGCGQALEYPN